MKKAIGIIPARYDSKRFPGKPLVKILGKPMIQWTWEQAKKVKSLERIVISTDDYKIEKVSKSFRAMVAMSSFKLNCGTERVAETIEDDIFEPLFRVTDYPIIINIQCDEIKFEPEIVDSLVELLQDDSIQMATIAYRNRNMEMNQDENVVKVGINERGEALWFSRSPIPYLDSDYFLQHIGIYGYQRDFLLKYKDLPDCPEEKVEGLEQLRALRAGVKIKVIESASATLSINTPDDIKNIKVKEEQ